MSARIFNFEHIRKLMGWCPYAKASQHMSTKTEYGSTWKIVKSSGTDPSPDPASTEGKTHHGYRENMLLIFLALLWMLPIIYQRELLPIFIILSAVAMYDDAQNVHAGSNFEKETFLGDIVTWKPISWAALTLAGGVIIMAIYLFHRKEIYSANN